MQRGEGGAGGEPAEGAEEADDQVGDAAVHRQQGAEGGGRERGEPEGHQEVQELHHAAVSI